MIKNIIISVFSFVIGACAASFADALSSRAPKGISIIFPPSRCDFCGASIRWYDNIPVISYIVLRGRCRFCKQKISAFSFVCEIFGGLALVGAYWAFAVFSSVAYKLPFAFVLAVLFLIIAEIDYKTQTIYNSSLWVYLAAALAYLIAVCAFEGRSPLLNFIGGVAGFAAFALIYLISGRLHGAEALGDGDVLLFALEGLMLGPARLLFAGLIASLVGCAVELPKALKRGGGRIALAPYLLLGAYAAFTAGDIVIGLFTAWLSP